MFVEFHLHQSCFQPLAHQASTECHFVLLDMDVNNNFILGILSMLLWQGDAWFIFFYLVYINVGKCNPIALMNNDNCNYFWWFFPVVYEANACLGCFGSQGLELIFQINIYLRQLWNTCPGSHQRSLFQLELSVFLCFISLDILSFQCGINQWRIYWHRPGKMVHWWHLWICPCTLDMKCSDPALLFESICCFKKCLCKVFLW